MFDKELMLEKLEGKTDDEKKQLLKDEFGMYFDTPDETCKLWFAKVFTFCSAYELAYELNNFLFFLNFLAEIFDFCFKPEDTVSIGCSCHCGDERVILYYSIKDND